jgi:putative ATP-dependent endonuclease of OLD family
MYIKKVHISNFRIFDECGVDIEFNSGINAIIGENNNGKSAIVDAIRIALTILSYRKNIYVKKIRFSY